MTPIPRTAVHAILILLLLLWEPSARADEADDFFKRHPNWIEVGELSNDFVAMIPADEGMDIGARIGGSTQIFESLPIFRYIFANNKDNTVSGEMLYMKKDGNPDVLQGFIDLAKRENGAITYVATIKKGDSANGVYFIVYKSKQGLWIYEKIINEYNTAIAYRLACKHADPQKPLVIKMVADFIALSK